MRTTLDRVNDVRRLQAAARAVVAKRRALMRAMVESTGLSPEGVELAFDRHIELDANDQELESLVATAGDAPSVALVLSANVFVGALRAMAVARAASNDVVVRPSRRDPTFARALVKEANALGDASLRIEEALDVAAVDHGEIHVYGRDETIADVRRRASVRVRGHGSGMGIAWISRRANVEETALALVDDVVVFDQRGCLSPRIAFVEGDDARGLAFADALHRALEERGEAIPRGLVPSDESAAIDRYVATMTYACRAWVGKQHAIGVAPAGAPIVLPPPYRTVHVAVCASVEDASKLVAPLARGIASVGSDDVASARSLLTSPVRWSRIGAMQRPPFDGPVDLRDASR